MRYKNIITNNSSTSIFTVGIREFIFLLTLSICFGSISFGQTGLSGIYCREGGDNSFSGEQYRFYENKTFVWQHWDEQGQSFGLGKYQLTNDSLILSFQQIPEDRQKNKVLSVDLPWSFSILNVKHALDTHIIPTYTYQIVREDSTSETMQALYFEGIQIKMKPGDTCKVYATIQTPRGTFDAFHLFEIPYNEQSKIYIAYMTGQPNHTDYKSTSRKAIPIKVSKEGQSFKLRSSKSWGTYNLCSL